MPHGEPFMSLLKDGVYGAAVGTAWVAGAMAGGLLARGAWRRPSAPRRRPPV